MLFFLKYHRSQKLKINKNDASLMVSNIDYKSAY